MRDSFIKHKLLSVYEILYKKKNVLELYTKYRLPIMNSKRTIRFIQKHHCSVARYGDGEFRLMLNVPNLNLAFQEKSPELSERLLKVFEKENLNLLICLPRTLNSTRGLKQAAKEFWTSWCRSNNNQINVVKLIRSHSRKRRIYGDTQISRPYMDMKRPALAKHIFSEWKKLWDQQDILILEGEQTRLGIGNDLFKNASSVKRILAPAINAFDLYERIKQTVNDNYNGELLLIALGPTATVLAADFSELGIWAIDIGHIDIEYEWYLNGAETKVAVSGKYTNEVEGGRFVEECNDEDYLRQIIARVSG